MSGEEQPVRAYHVIMVISVAAIAAGFYLVTTGNYPMGLLVAAMGAVSAIKEFTIERHRRVWGYGEP